MALKNLISSPLEAGQSVLDAHRLPSQLDAALEYTARRLARKSLSIDLVVIRREYQLPQTNSQPKAKKEQPQHGSQASIPHTLPSSTDSFMTKPLPPLPLSVSAPTASTSRFASALKGLVRSNTVPSQAPSSSAPATTASSTSKRTDGKSKWPFSPSRSLSSASAASSPSFPSISSPLLFSNAFTSTPATPCSPASPNTDASIDSFSSISSSLHSQTSASTNTYKNTHSGHHASVSRSSSVSSLSPLSFGIRLVHADNLPRTHRRILSHILLKAAQRFHLPPNWLPMPVHASEMGLPPNLVSRSVEQNQVLFQGGSSSSSSSNSSSNSNSDSGLVLRSLDHLYTFKAALCSYAQTGDRYRLEDAVDELRRYILLFNRFSTSTDPGRRSLPKRELLRQYPELSCFADRHIADVNRMYSRAYGGPEYESGIVGDGLSSSPPPSLDDHLSGRCSEQVSEHCEIETSNEEELSTPVATTVDDSALAAVTTRTESPWTWPSLESSTSPVPILGMTRRARRPTGMIFARPNADDRLTIVDSAPPTASSLSSRMSSVLSTPSSLPSLSLSMGSSVEEVMEQMLLMGQDQLDQNQDLDQDQTQAYDSVSPMTPADPGQVKLSEEKPPSKGLESTVSSSPESTVSSSPESTAVLFRPMARSFMPALPLPLPPSPTSPTSRLPMLKLQTTFTKEDKQPEKKDKIKRLAATANDDDEQLTARPVSSVRRTFFFGGGGLGSSIGEVLGDFAPNNKQRRSADTILTLASPLSAIDDPVSAGPVPPRSYDDISPITRSEWGFLKGDLSGRQVTVTTF